MVFWEGYVGASPSLISAIQALEEEGFRVDLITREAAEGFPEIPVFADSTRVTTCRPWSASWRRAGLPGRPPGLERDLDRLAGSRSHLGRWRSRLSRFLGSLLLRADLMQFSGLVRRVTNEHAHRFWIGVDVFGAAVTARFADPGTFAYWSLEITFGENLDDRLLVKLKELERSFTRAAHPVIVQDAQRADLLSRENGLDRDRIVLVPNSPRSGALPPTSTLMQRRLGTDDGTRLILHLGMMGPEVLSSEIAASTRNWPTDCTLVFHERYARTLDDPVVREVAGLGGNRVAFSLEPVSLDELPELVASADIGLVFYNPAMGENYSVITGASGKLAFCLQAGLPIVCLDLPGFSDLMREYGCGICVTEPDGIGDALRTILADPDPYRAGARRCFAERYAFDPHFAPVLARIRSVMSPS